MAILQRVPERLPPLKVCFIAKFRSKPLVRATSLSCQLCITAIIFMPVPQILQNWNNNHQSVTTHYFQGLAVTLDIYMLQMKTY